MENEPRQPLNSKRETFKYLLRLQLAASAVSFAGEAILSSTDGFRVPYVDGPHRIRNLTLDTLATNHENADWKRHSGMIQASVGKYSTIIPEYFPPEYDSSAQNSQPFYFTPSINYVFDEVARQLMRERKDVWVVDPAYCPEFLWLRAAANAPESAALATGFYSIWNSGQSRSERSRRAFLRTIASIGVSVALGVTVDVSKGGIAGAGLQEDFRRVCVAEGYHRLAGHFAEPVNALTIYPPSHWERIKYYLLNHEVRRERLKIYSQLREIPELDKLFMIRHYTSQDTADGLQWKLADKVPLIT
jgi:hypothetical protein